MSPQHLADGNLPDVVGVQRVPHVIVGRPVVLLEIVRILRI